MFATLLVVITATIYDLAVFKDQLKDNDEKTSASKVLNGIFFVFCF